MKFEDPETCTNQDDSSCFHPLSTLGFVAVAVAIISTLGAHRVLLWHEW